MTNQQLLTFPYNVYGALALCKQLLEKRGVHTVNHMAAAGFNYTGNGDTARCQHCNTEVSNWTIDMNPFTIHSKLSPDCRFVRSIKLSSLLNVPGSLTSLTNTRKNKLSADEQENPCKRRKIDLAFRSNILLEPDSIKRIRRRTFSHWPHRNSPSAEQMCKAGFFKCYFDDRSICLYCDLMCDKLIPNVDNLIDIHKTFSPDCPYVKLILVHGEPIPVINPGESSARATANNHQRASNNIHLLNLSTLARPLGQNQGYPGAHAPLAPSVASPSDKSPSIDELIKGDITCPETKRFVNSFCCKDLLKHWKPDADPKIEHARWFPQSSNAKQLCGDELYRIIQESQQTRQSTHATGPDVMANPSPTTNGQPSPVLDERIWSIIKQCRESRLTGKHDHSVCYLELLIARFIHQKEIQLIGDEKKHIVMPNELMSQKWEQAIKEHKRAPVEDCAVCCAKEKQLACIPCGHLAVCVLCGHSLRSCPMCRTTIEAFVRIYA